MNTAPQPPTGEGVKDFGTRVSDAVPDMFHRIYLNRVLVYDEPLRAVIRATANALAASLYARIAELEKERDALAKRVGEMEQRKDEAYLERNRCVAGMAAMALKLGYRTGIAKTAIEGWSEDWHGCVYIDLPTGQVSWHFHDSHAGMFSFLPPYPGKWDGHGTEEKYQRVALLQLIAAPAVAAPVEGEVEVGKRKRYFKPASQDFFPVPLDGDPETPEAEQYVWVVDEIADANYAVRRSGEIRKRFSPCVPPRPSWVEIPEPEFARRELVPVEGEKAESPNMGESCCRPGCSHTRFGNFNRRLCKGCIADGWMLCVSCGGQCRINGRACETCDARGVLAPSPSTTPSPQKAFHASTRADNSEDEYAPIDDAFLKEAAARKTVTYVGAKAVSAAGEQQVAGETLLSCCIEMRDALVAYQTTVDEEPPYKHRQIVARARTAIDTALAAPPTVAPLEKPTGPGWWWVTDREGVRKIIYVFQDQNWIINIYKDFVPALDPLAQQPGGRQA